MKVLEYLSPQLWGEEQHRKYIMHGVRPLVWVVYNLEGKIERYENPWQ